METDNGTLAHEEEATGWTGTYTWKVKNWNQLTVQRIYSPEFEIGGYSWRFLVFPKSNYRLSTFEYISVYLDFGEASVVPPQMWPTAKFEIMALKSIDPSNSVKREASHAFTAQARDWGFTKFMTFLTALNPEHGYLVNDTFTLRVNIFIQRNQNLGTISRLETGLLGVKGSEETSLLSSFLQCVFHMKALRKAVFCIPTVASDDPQKSLPLALQHLFYKLKCWKTSAKIEDLVNALDGDLSDVHLQYGMRKIQHILFDKLRKDFRANGVMGCISELFTGQHSTYIESLEIPDAPTFKQSFTDISLDVLDCKDIYASIEKLCQVQRLGESNPCGKITRELRELKHYMRFDSFPAILVFHLKRSYYNPDLNAILKVNTHYEFYNELDLDYNDRILLSNNADETIENKYKLHSVLVRAGGCDQGHYFAFIRHHKKWFKFDGETVKMVSAEEAINAQFGDQTGPSSANFSKEFKSIDKSAAVMLIYIRKSEWKKVLCNARNQHLPELIKEQFDKERTKKEKRQKEKQEAHAYVIINLATEFHCTEQIGKTPYFELADFDSIKHYRLHKKTLFEEFKRKVSEDFGIPKHLQRFWLWSKQAHNTVRVSKPLMEGADGFNSVLDLSDYKEKRPPLGQEKIALMTINLFLETPEGYSPGTDGILHGIQQDELMVFIKYHDPVSKELSYLGHLFVKKTAPFRSMLERVKKMAGLGSEDEVIGLKEVTSVLPKCYIRFLLKKAPREAQLVQGDVIIIQKLARDHNSEFPLVKTP